MSINSPRNLDNSEVARDDYVVVDDKAALGFGETDNGLKEVDEDKLMSDLEVAGVALEEVSKKNLIDALKSAGEEQDPSVIKDIEAWIKKNPKYTAVMLASGVMVLCPVSGPLLWVAGFGSQGPLAGSLAAAVQASIGNVVGGSGFAILQSAAMGGYGAAIVNGVISGGAAAVGLGTGAYAFMKGRAPSWSAGNDRENQEEVRDVAKL